MIATIAEALIGLLVWIITGVGLWWFGKRQGKQEQRHEFEIEEHNRRTATRQRIEEVNLGDDPDVLRDWLRNRDPNKR